ncbi:TPA: hypothetical protein ACPZQN_004013 [Yersinia enterocolitica]
MYFVDNGSAVPVMPQVKPVSSATPQFFTEGGNGTPPTYPGTDWFNIFQLELLNVLKEAQINPDKANHTQLVTAMKKLFLDASSNGSDIPDKAAFLSNLGLGAAATKGLATNADMQTGTSTELLTTVATIISLFPVRTFSDNDYIRIPDRPGGLIIQWRKNITDGSSSGNLHAFPTPFPNQFLFVVPVDLTTDASSNVAAIAVDYNTSTKAAAKIFVSPGNAVFSMLAIGR